ncbi:MAG: CRISPR system precrRNA processing endoribonuclease RAMP protein Cas6 [Candidatus Diapherotrites archaeon]
MTLPPYKGAVFRGAFGNAFRRLVCLVPKDKCSNCRHREKCLYTAIFEPSPPPQYPDAGKFHQAPRPYVLNPPLTAESTFNPGEVLSFELVLVGRAIDAIPYFIVIFSETGRHGLGRDRGRFELLSVELLSQDQSTIIYHSRSLSLTAFEPESGPQTKPKDDQVNRLTLEFLTPLRLKEKGDLMTRFAFPLFWERLTQRLSLLAAFYEKNPQLPDFAPLSSKASQIQEVRHDLRWHDWERYSCRQDATMKFGGLVGRVSLQGPLDPLLPFLRLGAQVNVGQETTFGLGRYSLDYKNQ